MPDAGMSVYPGSRAEVIVLGLGNLLRRDEGLGIRALERLRACYTLPNTVQLVDGGTLGLELLSYLEGTECVLILDATLSNSPPGTLLRVAGEQIPSFFGMRTSAHEIALADLLAVMKLRGSELRDLVLWGMQPATLEPGWELSEPVAAYLDALVAAVVTELGRWGLDVKHCEE
ncbi:MAG TPA: HyaD/HybD family hydrogenase maturation endopeptidase [Ktedonobacteraceae bacterium]|nr:HyaD/HybD family hydrogenase maturation endopeptidase [Ktedonobacteraceae bacterium]